MAVATTNEIYVRLGQRLKATTGNVTAADRQLCCEQALMEYNKRRQLRTSFLVAGQGETLFTFPASLVRKMLLLGGIGKGLLEVGYPANATSEGTTLHRTQWMLWPRGDDNPIGILGVGVSFSATENLRLHVQTSHELQVGPPDDLAAATVGAGPMTITRQYRVATLQYLPRTTTLGESAASSAVSIASAATLDADHKVRLSWTANVNEQTAGYRIYRTNAGGGVPASTGIIADVSPRTTSYDDDGDAATAGTPKTETDATSQPSVPWDDWGGLVAAALYYGCSMDASAHADAVDQGSGITGAELTEITARRSQLANDAWDEFERAIPKIGAGAPGPFAVVSRERPGPYGPAISPYARLGGRVR